jgi:hypothetical protein
VSDSPASNTELFVLRDTCVSSGQLHIPIWNRRASHHLEKPDMQEVFLLKPKSILKGKQCARCSTF